MKKTLKKIVSLMCAGAMALSGGEALASGEVKSAVRVSQMVINKDGYEREEALEVAGEPFFYNGVQIRIDKVVDWYHFDDTKVKKLFKMAKDDGFTVANVQIRWMDVQQDQSFTAKESAYIRGGSYKNQTFNTGGIQTYREEGNESNQALAYVKYDISGWTKGDIEGARIRVYNRNDLYYGHYLKVYALDDTSWSKDTLTWENAPGHNGYDVTGALLAETPVWDTVKSANYYDFDVTDYVEAQRAKGKKEVAFILQSSTPADKEPEVPIVMDDFDDTYAPQIFLSSEEEYDWEYLDKIIGWAEEYDLKIEILWFATDTCSLSTDIRVPNYAMRRYQKQCCSDGTPWLKKAALKDSITGLYQFILCKNDMGLREKEFEVLRTVFNHIGEYNAANGGKNTVIGCQVSNEPNVARLHGGSVSENGEKLQNCRCETCVSLKKNGGYSDQGFRDLVMFEYNNNLSKAVKTSDYPVWTRVNNVQGNDAWGVTYNENKRSSGGSDKDGGTYLDFIGLDPYGWGRSGLYGFGSGDYSYGHNLPVVMECGGENSMSALMMLATVAGGGFYNVYDLCSPDGHHLYDQNLQPRVISSGDKYLPDGGTYIEDVRNHNHWLNKIAYELATKKPDKIGGKNLMFFNCEGTDNSNINVTKQIGGMDVTYKSDVKYSSGIAVKRSENEVVLLSSKDTGATFILSDIAGDVKSVQFGHYEGESWVRDEGEVTYAAQGESLVITMPSFSVVRVETENPLPAPAVFEAENLLESCSLSASVTKRTVDESGASGGKWACFENTSVGSSITFKVTIPEGMESAQISTGYKSKGSGRGNLKLSVNGTEYGGEINLTADELFRATAFGPIVKLKPGEENTFTYTVTKAGVIGIDYIALMKGTVMPPALDGAVLIDESFSSGSDFGFDKGASVSGGTLNITQNMGNYTTSVKMFDAEIINQKVIDLSFDWKNNITSAGKKSGIEFRDMYGRLVFAIESKGGTEFRHSTSGYDSDSSQCEYTWEPIWNSTDMNRDKTYTVRLYADFANKSVSCCVAEKDTGAVIAQQVNVPTEASSLAKMVAANYYTNENGTQYVGTQNIDNFRLVGGEPVTLLWKDKTVYAFGDSIVGGHLYQSMGFVEFTSLKEGMVVSYNGAENGAAVGDILKQVEAAPEESPDMVIFDGGINDAYDKTDITEFKSAFAELIDAMKEKWQSARIIYTAVHKTAARDEEIQSLLYEIELEICREKGVETADVFSSGFDATVQELRWRYSFDELGFDNLPGNMGTTSSEKYSASYPSGTHPNFRGIEEFYVPALSETITSRAPEGGTNLSVGKSALATAEENGNGRYSPAANAVDGNLTTRYSSYTWDGGDNISTLPQALMIDLWGEAEIHGISSYWYGNDRKYKYDIYITNEPTVTEDTFTAPSEPVYEAKNLEAQSGGTSMGTVKDTVVLETPAVGRYVTIYTTYASEANAATIFEVSVYGDYVGRSIYEAKKNADINVLSGTEEGLISLPESAKFILNDKTEAEMKIKKWNWIDKYDPETGGAYRLEGEPEGGEIETNGVKAQLCVNVLEGDEKDFKAEAKLENGNIKVSASGLGGGYVAAFYTDEDAMLYFTPFESEAEVPYNERVKKLKVFVWESLGALKPLVPCIEIAVQ